MRSLVSSCSLPLLLALVLELLDAVAIGPAPTIPAELAVVVAVYSRGQLGTSACSGHLSDAARAPR